MKVLLQLPDFSFIASDDKHVVDIEDQVDLGLIPIMDFVSKKNTFHLSKNMPYE